MNLRHRMAQHKEHRPGTYTARYNIDRLVYYEQYQYVINAISRETELKHWTRAQKIALIESVNPTWEDLPFALRPADPATTCLEAVSLREWKTKNRCNTFGSKEIRQGTSGADIPLYLFSILEGNLLFSFRDMLTCIVPVSAAEIAIPASAHG